MENWKKIEGYPNYSVSDLGRVRNDKTGMILKPSLVGRPGRKYLSVVISNKGKIKHFYLHRLVILSFIPNAENLPQVNHKDGNKLNNNLDNLEWCDNSHNVRHALKNGLIQPIKGENHHKSKVTEQEVLEIRRLRSEGWGQNKLAEKFGVSQFTISVIEHKKSWKHL